MKYLSPPNMSLQRTARLRLATVEAGSFGGVRRRSFAGLLVAVLVIFSVCCAREVAVGTDGPGTERDRAAVAASSRAILELIDARRYEEARQAANPAFRLTISPKAWADMIGSLRAVVGTIKSRTIGTVRFTNSIAGQPKGDYAEVIYDSTFTTVPSVGEKVTMQKLDGKWFLAGYFVGKHFKAKLW